MWYMSITGSGSSREFARSNPAAAAASFMLLRYADDARLDVPLRNAWTFCSELSVLEGTLSPLDKTRRYRLNSRKTRPANPSKTWPTRFLAPFLREEKARRGLIFTGQHFQREFEDALEFEETTDRSPPSRDHQARTWNAPSHGPPALRRRRLRKNRSRTWARRSKRNGQRKQVAILAPTTSSPSSILKRSRNRFAAFPARIEISAASAAPRSRKKFRGLGAGKVDVVHRPAHCASERRKKIFRHRSSASR